jgi:hypothetical protein
MESWPRGFALFLALLFVVKMTVILVLGTVSFEDSGLYLHMGDMILTDPSWLTDGHWALGLASDRLFRPYGYPLLIAATKWAGGTHFWSLIALLQVAGSVAALALVGRMAKSIVTRPGLWWSIVGLCALSGFQLFDAALLTDSLYTSLFLIVMGTLVTATVRDRGLSTGLALMLGVAWAVSMTLRDVGLYYTILPVAWLIAGTRKEPLGKILGLGAAFLLPIVGLVGLTLWWNLYRTGHLFFSLTGTVNWLWPSFNISDQGLAAPFDCADAVCGIVRDHGIGKGMAGVAAVADILTSDWGLDPIALGKISFAHFLSVVQAHPFAYLVTIINNMRFDRLADLAFNPLANLNDFIQLGPVIQQRLLPGTRELFRQIRQGDLATIPLFLAVGIPHLLSWLGLALFLVGAPLVALRRLGHERRAAVTLGLWITVFIFIGGYSLVHMETRHALPIVPFILVAAAWVVETRLERSSRSF